MKGFLFSLFFPVFLSGTTANDAHRVHVEKSFPNATTIDNRTIFCAELSEIYYYPYPTLTCKDIRIQQQGEEGQFFLSFEGSIPPHLCHYREELQLREKLTKNNPMNSDKIESKILDFRYKHYTDYGLMCKLMLKAYLGKNDFEIISATARETSCSRKDKRMRLVNDYTKTPPQPYWKKLEPDRGYLNTLNCHFKH